MNSPSSTSPLVPSDDDFASNIDDPRLAFPSNELNEGVAAFVRNQNRRHAHAKLFGSPQRAEFLGHFRLLQLIGQGGMGVVYSALDEVLNRKVAIKLVQTQEHARGRLLRESQALARLSHPNVVQIYEVGEATSPVEPSMGGEDTENGDGPKQIPLAFIVMELIDGVSLDVWLAEPRSRAEILSTFISAGRGLAAAHAVGLVHRDFKPQNVMLGNDGRIRVMDFGLARYDSERDTTVASIEELDEPEGLASELTQEHNLLGTPVYMAPEQLSRETAGTTSDQFGFCVALYEALYGQRPFVSSSFAELRRAVCAGEIEPAPKTTTVPTWLRRVLVRGLAVERGERWPSMDALLDALSHDPALGRRKLALSLGLAATFAVGIWGASVLTQAPAPCADMDAPLAGVWDDARRGVLEGALMATQRGHADEVWTSAEAGLETYARGWVEARTATCESTQRGEHSPLLLDRSMACLDGHFEQFRATLDEIESIDPETLDRVIGAVIELPPLERCTDAEALLAAHPPPEDPALAAKVELAGDQLDRATVLQRFAKWEEGSELATAIVEQAKEFEHPPLLARALLRLGALQQRQGNSKDAEPTLEQAYDVAVAAQLPKLAGMASAVLVYVVGNDLGRHEDGRRWAQHADPWSRAAKTPEARAEYNNNLGLLATHEGKFEEAKELYELAARDWELGLGSKHPNLAGTLHNLCSVETKLASYDSARAYCEQAIALREAVFGSLHPHISETVGLLGNIALAQGDYAQAGVHFDRAIEIIEELEDPNENRLAAYVLNRGIIAAKQGDTALARRYYERNLEIVERAFGPDHPKIGMVLVNLGGLLEGEGKYDEARANFERALELLKASFGPDHPNLGAVYNNLGTVARGQGEFAEAEGYYRQALALREPVLGLDHPVLAYSLIGLGEVALARGEAASGLPELERALALRKPEQTGPDALAKVRFVLARALWEAPANAGGDRKRALELGNQALEGYAEDEAFEERRAEVDSWLDARREL